MSSDSDPEHGPDTDTDPTLEREREPEDLVEDDRKRTRRTLLRSLAVAGVGAIGVGGGLVARSSAAQAPRRPLSEVTTDASAPLMVGPAIDESATTITESGANRGPLATHAVDVSGEIDTTSVPSRATPDVVIAQAMTVGDRLELNRMRIGITNSGSFSAELEAPSRWFDIKTVQLWIRYENSELLDLPGL